LNLIAGGRFGYLTMGLEKNNKDCLMFIKTAKRTLKKVKSSLAVLLLARVFVFIKVSYRGPRGYFSLGANIVSK
jgi:hypothetical protein